MAEFDYEELREATENFSPIRLVGKGSHGSIYKAILRDGNVVAIKRASPDNSKNLKNESFHTVFSTLYAFFDTSCPFGVLLLEIISCRRAIDVSQTSASIVEWAMPLIQLDWMVQIFDSRIPDPRCMADTLRCMLHMAVCCMLSDEKSHPSIGVIIVEIESCLIQQVRLPMWTSIGRSLILLRKRKMIRRQHGTTVM
ncbi:hypothetical protein RJ641_018873 [Dillenia turbinata]|uniref:Protein kinase domain-containing protein n=1 Tax=Dillenia turbinata TaxID=194707 RepID=A0AAN8USQ3_9MAGN